MNKYIGIIIFGLLFCRSIYANGKVELPSEYYDLGTIYVSDRPLRIDLPYNKPEGIYKIISDQIHGIIIDEIIIDNKKLNVKKSFFDMSAYEHLDRVYEENVCAGEDRYFMTMNWEKREKGLHYSYFSRNGKIKYSPDYYYIPFGINKVYIMYRIRLVGNYQTNFQTYYASERYAAKLNLIWE